MKVYKAMALMCAAAITLGVATGCGNKNSSIEVDENGMKTIVAKSENVKLVGRTELMDDTLWLALSGSGMDFNYTGKDLKISVEGDGAADISTNDGNYARVAVYVDGERVVDEMINEPEKTFEVFSSDESKTVSVQVIKLSETAMSTVGVKPIKIAPEEEITPAAAKTHRIEFIGDSITCGYGVDDEDQNHHFSTATEDVTKAYAYKTAQALDADYSMFSVSGYGIISGYTDNGNAKSDQTIPQYYNSLGFSYNSFAKTTRPQDIEWDFSKFQPEVVVVNLGTNDDSYCAGKSDRQSEYAAKYVEFLKDIRSKNPDAKIFMTVGIMGGRIYTAVEEAYIAYKKETGDENVSIYKFDQQDGSVDGIAADWHPTEATHQKAADKFAEEIKTVMSW